MFMFDALTIVPLLGAAIIVTVRYFRYIDRAKRNEVVRLRMQATPDATLHRLSYIEDRLPVVMPPPVQLASSETGWLVAFLMDTLDTSGGYVSTRHLLTKARLAFNGDVSEEYLLNALHHLTENKVVRSREVKGQSPFNRVWWSVPIGQSPPH